jgi:hypothetical protein
MIEKPPAIWLPPKPAIIRAWKREDTKRATFPFPFFVPGQADLFPVIEETITGNEIAINVTTNVTMPATVNAGDLLIVLIACWSSSSALNWTTPGTWNLIVSAVGSGQMRRLGSFYKIADGTEDGNTVNFVTNQNAFNAWTIYRITGYTGTPEGNTIATSTASAPDSSTLSPSWGSKATLWISHCGSFDTVQTAQANAPSNYVGFVQDFGNSSSQDRPRHASAHRFLRAASEDPGAFGTAVDNWAAYTVAIQGLN